MSHDLDVIVVEDEPLVALLIEEMLQEMGFTVASVAHTDTQAIKALTNPEIDLAVLDINLGNSDSRLVAEECRRLGVPIIYATGYSVQDVPRECLEWPIVPKPFSQLQMQDALNLIRTDRRGGVHHSA